MISLCELVSDNYISLSKCQINDLSCRDVSTDQFTLGVEWKPGFFSSSWTVFQRFKVDGRGHLVCTRRCVDDSGMSIRGALGALRESRDK